MLVLVFTSIISQAGNSIVINEFQADPAGDITGDANGDGVRDATEDEFIELYNDTGSALDVSGWTLSDAALVRHTFPASSVIPAGCSLVVFGGGTPTGTFGDAVVQTASTGGLGLTNGGDTITVNDGLVDQASHIYGSEGGNNQSVTRDPDITGTFTEHSTATGSGGSLFSPGTGIDGTSFGGCSGGGDTAPAVTSTDPADSATNVAVDTQITINFDESVDATIDAVTLTCDAMTQTFTGLPASGNSVVITPDADLPFDGSCDVVVVAAEVTDQDGMPDNMTADVNFSFNVESATQPVIINEFQADPASGLSGDANGDGVRDGSDDEFVEIYNNSGADLDVSGWTLSDAVQVRHTFPAATVIPSDCSVVVFGGGTPTGLFGNSVVQIASGGFIGLNNGGDTITINDGVSDVATHTYGAEGGNNQSLNLEPDITGVAYVEHSLAAGSGGTLFSPGTLTDGSSFGGCLGMGDLPPSVNTTTPADNDSGVALDTDITINFSEAVDASAGAATLTCDAAPITFTGLPVSNATQVVLNPDADLPNGTTCTLTLLAAEVTDLDGSVDQLDGNGDGTGGDNFVMQFGAGFPEVEIFEIQGNGLASPYAGQAVTTLDNIVTALDTNGFYMQTPDGRNDVDPLTSSGIFVFTGGAPMVAVGDQVDVTGDIVEFFDLTEFANPGSLVVTVDSSGNPLPEVIVLDDTFPSTDPTMFPCGSESLGFECYEGMHFNMPQAFVSAASAGFFGNDRDDAVIKAGSSRAFREPGIDFPGLPNLPVFDGNPELIEMSVEALGLPFQALSAGTEFSAQGVLSYGFGDYELQPSVLTIINENVIPGAVRDALPTEFTIGSANLFRLFNDINDPEPEDDDQIADPAEYAARLQKLGNYFVNDMKSPTIIGLQEIERITVLFDLINAITTAGGPTYTAELIAGNDQGGINVAYLYRADLLSNVTITQLGAADINTFDGSLLHDRPPLRLQADVTLPGGTLPINVLTVHQRSRSSIDDAVDGDRVRSKRLQQANSVALMARSIIDEDPDVSLYVIGDFNAFEFTDGYVDVIGQITGTAVDADNLLWSEPEFSADPLTQGIQTLPADQQYSFIFRGSAQSLDNVIMNDAGLMNLNEMQFVRGQADANVNFEDDDTTSLRSTDHDGFVLFVTFDFDLIFKDGFD